MDFSIILGLLLCYLYQTNGGAVRFFNDKNATFETIELKKVRNHSEFKSCCYSSFHVACSNEEPIDHFSDCLFYMPTHKKPTRFMDLNFDCKILILEQLDLVNLIVLSETTKKLRIPISNVVSRKFHNKFISFAIPYFTGKTSNHIYETDAQIKIQHLQTMFKVLKYFGSLIRNLKVEVSYSPDARTHSLYKYINFYCSETLTQFHMKNAVEAAFDEFRKPFENVQSVSLRGQFDSLDGCTLRFSEIFPAMRRLSVRMVCISDMNWIEHCAFQHLEHLHIYMAHANHDSIPSEKAMNFELIKKNPRIRSLELENVSLQFLMFVAHNLPKLERLELQLSPKLIGAPLELQIHFEYLKVLKLQQHFQELPESLFVENLEELEIDAYPKDLHRLNFL